MLEKINKLPNIYTFLIIAAVGSVVFTTGLTNPFIGDDSSQIVESAPAHSISHIKLFFEGGTFYNGGGLAPLSGVYYRPLMTTAYALVYTIFGSHPLYFHLLQLMFHIGAVIFLFLFFRFMFKTAWALALALIFLVHPMNSQAVMALPAMQDTLYFFFGILALWLLVQFRSIRSLGFVALCLTLSLLSKETGALFVVLCGTYLGIFERKRLLPFVGIMTPIAVLYLILRTHAVGWLQSPGIAPIAHLSLGGRLLTTPSIILFYLTKFIFPDKLSTAYYWTHPTFSIQYTLVPLIIELLLVVGLIFLGRKIYREAKPAIFYTWVFFLVWVLLGMVVHLPFSTLDMTACETWSYFINAGLLGLIGMSILATKPRILRSVSPNTLLLVVAGLIVLLGFRTAMRGFDYRTISTMARRDISTTSSQYIAYNLLATQYLASGNNQAAKDYAQKSVDIFPTAVNYNTLGEADVRLKDYKAAYEALNAGLRYQGLYQLYLNLSLLTAFYGNVDTNEQFLMQVAQNYPNDVHPWLYLAILEYNQKDNVPLAKQAITKAHQIAPQSPIVDTAYQTIMNGQPLHVAY